MPKKLFLITMLFFALLASAVSAQEDRCKVIVDARDTQSFIDMVEGVNQLLASCPLELPRSASWLLGQGNTLITIERANTSETFAITQENRLITTITRGLVSERCTQKITLNEQALDSILAQDDRAGSVKDAYSAGVMRVEGCTRTRQAINSVVKRLIGLFI